MKKTFLLYFYEYIKHFFRKILCYLNITRLTLYWPKNMMTIPQVLYILKLKKKKIELFLFICFFYYY